MRIVELILDEESELGIEAISVVENPAIEEDFVALKSQEFKLAEIDGERRILMGALLIPNKPIYRRNGEDEYYIYFSKDIEGVIIPFIFVPSISSCSIIYFK